MQLELPTRRERTAALRLPAQIEKRIGLHPVGIQGSDKLYLTAFETSRPGIPLIFVQTIECPAHLEHLSIVHVLPPGTSPRAATEQRTQIAGSWMSFPNSSFGFWPLPIITCPALEPLRPRNHEP